MAESDSGQDKTEEPTGKRLADARKKGQIPRSRELNTTIMLIISAISFFYVGGFFGGELLTMMRSDFMLDREHIFDKQAMLAGFVEDGLHSLKMLAPFFVLTIITAFIGPLVLGGWNFTMSSMAPKFSKMNPASGIKRMFGPNGGIELLKALAKVILLGSLGTILLWTLSDEILNLSSLPIETAIIEGGRLMLWEFLALSAILLIVAGIDVPYQLYSHKKKLKMTLKEIKDENKETQGNPEIKGKIKALQREAAMRRMLQDVPNAAVVLVNPTHFSVALRYDEDNDYAPVMVAKGEDHMAFRIREVAEEHGVPIFSAPPLTRAIYFSTEIGEAIPSGLYIAVAKILAYLFQLKQATGAGPAQAEKPSDIEIPEEFKNLSQRNRKFDR